MKQKRSYSVVIKKSVVVLHNIIINIYLHYSLHNINIYLFINIHITLSVVDVNVGFIIAVWMPNVWIYPQQQAHWDH